MRGGPDAERWRRDCEHVRHPDLGAGQDGVGTLEAAAAERSRRRRRLLPVLLGVGVFLIGTSSPSVQVTDSRLTVATATSLLTEGDLDLDEFEQVDRLGRPYDVAVAVVDGHRMWYFPWPIALFAVPAVAVAQLFGVDTGGLRPSDTNQTWPSG